MPQQIGVQAIIDVSQLQSGVSAYLSAINQMNAASASLRSPAISFAPVQAQMQNLSSSAIGFSAGIGAAIGTAAVDAVQALISAFSSLSREIVENVGFWERLTISTEFYAASAKQAADPTLSMADALGMVGEEAQATIAYIQKLAIFSPFTSKEVGILYRTAQGFGLAKNEAEALLPLLVDLGSAAGLDKDYLERVALAIAQVAARGKLAGEEVRQLGNAGVPIRKILVEALGITNKQFDEMLEAGEFVSSTTIPLIIKNLEKYRGAAKRAATETITGLLSSLQDIREVGLAKFFGSAADQIKTQLQALVNVLTGARVLAAFQVLGEELGKEVSWIVSNIQAAVASIINAWNALNPVTQRTIVTFVAAAAAITIMVGGAALLAIAIGALINPFTVLVGVVAAFTAAWINDFMGIKTATEQLVSAVMSAFSNMVAQLSSVAAEAISIAAEITDAFSTMLLSAAEWGSGIVASFSEGITAAVGMVIEALSILGQAMSYLLAPGSPPRLLPDLDKWGTESANVWLSSWTDADFSILNDITSTMRDVLQSLIPTGGIAEVDIPGMLLGAQGKIAAAIDEIRTIGRVTDETMQAVATATGAASEQIVGMISRYAVLANATENLQQAQDALNETTKTYDDMLSPLRDQLAAINEAQQQSDEQKQIIRLQRIIASQTASQARKAKANQSLQEIQLEQRIRQIEREQALAVDGAQSQVEAAQSVFDSAQAELDAWQERIKIQTQQGDLEAESLRLHEAIKKSISDTNERVKAGLSDLEKQLKFMGLQKAELDDQISLARAQAVLEDDKATAAQKYAAQMEITTIQLRQQQRIVEAIDLGFDPKILEEIRKVPIVLADWDAAAARAKKGLGDLGNALGDLNNPDIKIAFEEYKQALIDFRVEWMLTKVSLGVSVEELNKNLPAPFKLTSEEAGKLPPIINTLAISFAGLTALLVGSNLIKAVSGILSIFGGFTGVASIAGSAFSALSGALGTLGATIMGLNPIVLALAAAMAVLGAAWFLNIGGLQDKTKPIFDWLSTEFGKLLTQVQAWSAGVQKWLGEGGAQRTFKEFSDTVRPSLQRVTEAWNDFIQRGFESEKLQTLLADIQKWFVDAAARIKQVVITEWVPAVVAWATDANATIRNKLDEFGAYVDKWIKNKGPELLNRFKEEWWPAFVNWIDTNASATLTRFGEWYASISAWIALAASQLAANFRTEWLPVLSSWVEEGSVVIARLTAWLDGIIAWIVVNAPLIYSTFVNEWVPAFYEWMTTTSTDLYDRFTQWIDNITGWIAATSGLIQQKFTDEWLPAFSAWYDTNAQPIIDRLELWLMGIGDWIAVTAVSIHDRFVNEWGPALVDWVVVNTPILLENLKTWATNVWAWISTNATDIYSRFVNEWIPAFTNWALNISEPLRTQLGAWLAEFWAWISTNATEIYNRFVNEWLPAFIGWIQANVPVFIANLQTWAANLWDWISTTAVTLYNNFMTTWGPAMVDWVLTNIGPFMANLAGWLNQGIAWLLNTGLPQFLIAVLNFATTLTDWVGIAIREVIPRLGEFIGTIVGWIISDGIPALLVGGEKLAHSFILGVQQLPQAVSDWAASIGLESGPWGQVLTKLTEFGSEIVRVFGDDLIPSIVQGISNLIGSAFEGVIKLFGPERIGSISTEAQAFGKAIIDGMLLPMQSAGELIRKTILDVVASVVQFFKDALGIHSPSQLIYDEVGKAIVDGLVNALSDGIKAITDAIIAIKDAIFSQDIIDGFIKSAGDLGTSIASGITSAITGKLDEAKKGIEDFINGLLGTGKEKAETGSPSRLFARELGEPIGQGIVEGINGVSFDILGKIVKEAVLAAFTEMRAQSSTEIQTMAEETLVVINAMKLAIAELMNQLSFDYLYILSSMAASSRLWFTTMGTETMAIMSVFAVSLTDAWNSIKTQIDTSTKTIYDLATNSFTTMRDKVVEIVKDMGDKIKAALDALVKTIDDEWVPKGYDLGEAFMMGVEKGMRDRIDDISAAAAAAVSAAIKAAKEAAETGSPSRRAAREIGAPIAEGIASGIISRTAAIARAATSMIDSTLNSIRVDATSERVASIATTSNVTYVRNYNLHVNSNRDARSMRNEFATMEMIAL